MFKCNKKEIRREFFWAYFWHKYSWYVWYNGSDSRNYWSKDHLWNQHAVLRYMLHICKNSDITKKKISKKTMGRKTFLRQHSSASDRPYQGEYKDSILQVYKKQVKIISFSNLRKLINIYTMG